MYLLECEHNAITPNPALAASKSRLSPTNLEELSDEDLVALCKKELPNNTRCYDELVNRYRQLVHNYSLRFIGNSQDAEEICQDAFVRVFKSIHQFEGRSKFKTWLFRIVTNLCLSQRSTLAKRRERQELFSEEANTLFHADMADVGTEELAERIQNALNRLDEQKRRIVTLKFVSGLQIEEIAALLNLKLSATKMRLYRARDELREAYFQQSEEGVAA